MARGGFESVIRKGRWNEVFEAMPRDSAVEEEEEEICEPRC